MQLVLGLLLNISAEMVRVTVAAQLRTYTVFPSVHNYG